MDAYIHDVASLVYQSDLLLVTALIGRYAHEAGKLADTEVHMHDEVAWFHLLQLLHGQCHLSLPCLVRFEVELMETIKYLMIGKEACPQVVVYEARMQRLVNGNEGFLFQNLLEPFLLFG